MALSCYVYYCSGHGFGHGTRVSAFASQLLSLPETKRPVIHIVSSAPSYVFGDSIALGAQYRYADWIDPVIVQPLAYRVDRQKSVEVLKAFLKNKDRFLEIEREWLTSVKARCVLSDAAFLGCLAAKAAGVPSILVTNFTFDSVYSYLATTFIDECSVVSSDTSLLSPDVSVAHPLLEPLVSQIHAGYCCADLLLLLPGHIPIPSFPNQPSLPATDWVNSQDNSFSPEIIQHLCCLKKTPFDCILHDHIPFPPTTVLAQKSAAACFTRKVFPMPLLVRPASSSVERSPYTPEGRAQLLNSANVPPEMHNPEMTKILVVSFGGQVLKWPGTAHSSAVGAQIQTEKRITPTSYPKIGLGIDWKNPKTPRPSQIDIPNPSASSLVMQFDDHPVELDDHRDIDPQPNISPRLATPSHIWIPGAPPVVNPTSPGVAMGVAHSPPFFERDIEKENEPQSSIVTSSRMKTDSLTTTFPPLTEIVNMHASSSVVTPGSISRCGDKSNEDSHYRENISVKTVQPQLLPDSSWIAIICGASDEQRSDTSTLPENFYLAPKDVYMPDLTVIADVLLGKLGYGTVAECIDAGTPMVYVSRPLFVEELGLRILLEKEGTGVEMSRADYEGGRWVERVKEAWEKARVAKEWKRKVEGGEMMLGANRITEREVEIRDMARVVVDWVDNCWRGI